MSLYEPVFTNSVKDVIGNEPVLDQFDIFYEASYYKTTQDDYVTGSILKVSTVNTKKQLTTGSRGRVFSKLYASSQPPLESSYGSEVVNRIPSLSYRLPNWTTKASRSAYRLIQCFDSSERYYDSCIPNLNACFKTFGSSIWSIDANISQFSPYANVMTSSVGYMFFDSIEFDRSSDGFDNDPTTVNGWTRSFPYEARYSSARRILGTDSLLGIGQRELSVEWGRRSKQELLMPTLTVSFLPVVDEMYDSTTAAGKEDLDLSNVRRVTPKPIQNFIPIIPGYTRPEKTNGSINSLRSKVIVDGGYGEIPINMGSYIERSVDAETGYSLLLPADVYLNRKVSHGDYLQYYTGVADPGPEYSTGSMGTQDLVKFLFGFGDLNNVTYGRRAYDNSKIGEPKYVESFEGYSQGTLSTGLSSYKDNYFEVNWGVATLDFMRSWRVATNDGSIAPSSVDPYTRYFKSGSKPDGQKGVKWIAEGGDTNILVSATSRYLNGPNEVPSGALGPSGEYSVTYVDITSSYPWNFSFDRAVCGNSTDTLTTVFTGVPGFSSYDLAGYPLVALDQVAGSANPSMSTYDYMTDGTAYAGSSDNKDYPLPPGRWRLAWQFSSGSGVTTNPSYAAINNLKLYSCSDFEKTAMIGSNNLPDFSLKAFDGRLNPTLTTTPLYDGRLVFNTNVSNLHFSSSADIYRSYVFGVSPVIRGWKYGLVSGFPFHTKTIFRRGRYGQFRDMLEQRQYTKFVNVNISPTDEEAVVSSNGFDKSVSTSLTLQGTSQTAPSQPVAEVKFVKKVFVKLGRQEGIGTLETRLVSPGETTSQNLSTEVTSSLPYFDGLPRHRSEEEMRRINRSSFVDSESTISQITSS